MRFNYSLVIFIFLIVGCKQNKKSYDIIPYYNQIQSLRHVGGFMVGDGPDPSEFYLLSKKILELGNAKTYTTMLEDNNPIVKSMGIVCLSYKIENSKSEINKLIDDQTVISVFPFGCTGEYMTVGKFAAKILNIPGFRYCFIEDHRKNPEEWNSELIEYLESDNP
jgi:hypothetical protein